MKEFGTKEGAYFYVVYHNGDFDPNYESDKKEILRRWDELTIIGVKEIMAACVRNEKPYEGIPQDDNKEILAIVIGDSTGKSASFLRIMPRLASKRDA